MGNKTKGYIYLHKTLLDNPLWTSGEKFGLRDAWIDLLLRANYEDSEAMGRSGDVLTVHRGQILTSQAKLSERWGWSRSKVHRVLDNLQSAGMIYFSIVNWDKGATLITVRNYDFYQSPNDFKKIGRTGDRTQKSKKTQKSETQTEHQMRHLNASDTNGYSDSVKSERTPNGHLTDIERTSNESHLNKYNEFYNEINEEGELIEWEE